jgi:hypothetical protein
MELAARVVLPSRCGEEQLRPGRRPQLGNDLRQRARGVAVLTFAEAVGGQVDRRAEQLGLVVEGADVMALPFVENRAHGCNSNVVEISHRAAPVEYADG